MQPFQKKSPCRYTKKYTAATTRAGTLQKYKSSFLNPIGFELQVELQQQLKYARLTAQELEAPLPLIYSICDFQFLVPMKEWRGLCTTHYTFVT